MNMSRNSQSQNTIISSLFKWIRCHRFASCILLAVLKHYPLNLEIRCVVFAFFSGLKHNKITNINCECILTITAQCAHNVRQKNNSNRKKKRLSHKHSDYARAITFFISTFCHVILFFLA